MKLSRASVWVPRLRRASPRNCSLSWQRRPSGWVRKLRRCRFPPFWSKRSCAVEPTSRRRFARLWKKAGGYEMSVEILLPKLGFSMNEGVIAEWLVADGAAVQAGAPLYSIESDKAVQEIEAPASGRLRIIVQPGMSNPVGTVLGMIE